MLTASYYFGPKRGCKLKDTIKIGEKRYDLRNMDQKSLKIYNQFLFAHRKLYELQSTLIVLNKAKNGYIEGIKSEIIRNKTGLDIESFFSSD